MEGNFVQAFLMGFVMALLLFIAFSGLLYIFNTEGMEREEAEKIVELTNGKFLAEIMEQGHQCLQEITPFDDAERRSSRAGKRLSLSAERKTPKNLEAC